MCRRTSATAVTALERTYSILSPARFMWVRSFHGDFFLCLCRMLLNEFQIILFQIQMQAASPVPRNSPLTVTTTTSRYESSTRNHVSSPRNYSLSPTSQVERASPVNYVPASTQRVASPINMQRVTSPITTITHRVTTPLTSPLTVKVRRVAIFFPSISGK